MLRSLTLALLAIGVPVAAQVAPARPSASRLQPLLEAEIARFPGVAGIHVKHLTTGEEAGVRADDDFNTASVIKIPVLVLAYQKAGRGELDLDRRLTIGKAEVRGGSGIFRYNDVGLTPTVRDVLRQMIITSDNTATDLAIAQVGGVRAVNDWLRTGHFARTVLVGTTDELFRRLYEARGPQFQGLSAEDVYALMTNNPAWATAPDKVRPLLAEIQADAMAEMRNRLVREERTAWLGVTTPRETSLILEAIERGTVAASPAAADEMKAMFRQQQSGARRLPHYVTIPVGHKTGDFAPMLANDVGILYTRSGPVVVSFFSNAIRGSYGEAEDRIGEIGRLIVAYFDGT
jgi:beta-lactamase class A